MLSKISKILGSFDHQLSKISELTQVYLTTTWELYKESTIPKLKLQAFLTTSSQQYLVIFANL